MKDSIYAAIDLHFNSSTLGCMSPDGTYHGSRTFATTEKNLISNVKAIKAKKRYLVIEKNFSQMRIKTGYCGVFDGDYKDDPNYSIYHDNDNEFTFFLYPYRAPEKFLVTAYLNENPHPQLQSALNYTDHHALFQEMANLGIAAYRNQAREVCWNIFCRRPEFNYLKTAFDEFITKTVTHFSERSD